MNSEGVETRECGVRPINSPRAPGSFNPNDDDIVQAPRKRGGNLLDDANAPQEDRYIEISPAQRAAFLKLDQFVNGDYQALNGTINQATKAAMMGNFLGIPIGVSTNVNGSNAAGHDNLLFQKEAFALAVQLNSTAHGWFDVNYLADKAVVEHIYGSAIMRNDHSVDMKGA